MKSILLFLIALTISACVQKETPSPASTQTPSSADFRKGEYFNDSTDHKDSAFFYFNSVTENSKDSLLVAMAYAYMAMIQNSAADYYGVQESALAGIRLLSETNPDHAYSLSSLYNVLGRSNVGLKNYDAAIAHYNLSMKFLGNENYRNASRNNIAVALRDKGDFKGALEMFLSIKPEPDESKVALARRITNIASLKWKAGNYNPVADLHHALALRLEMRQEIGITASYNHLSDYYLSNNRDSALFYAHKMYFHSMITKNEEDQLAALRKLTSLVPIDESRHFFERYENLADSIQTARNAAKNQFAVIRYESEKSKAENLALHQDNERKRLQILYQRILSVAIVLFSALIVLGAVWYYRKKKVEEQRRAQALIRENHLQLSEKIHDTVANGLYRIMSEIEHDDVVDKEKLLDRVEELYERSRDISYEPHVSGMDANERINQTLASFATPSIKVSVVGNRKELWADISPGVVKELEHVLQELLVNMKKHSSARHVVFNFTKTANRLHVLYKDDGLGFKSNFEKGNGLRSTENRIRQMGGHATFTSGNPTGAEIKIIVPTILK